MKQLGAAFMAYTTDWNERYPREGQGTSGTSGWVCSIAAANPCWPGDASNAATLALRIANPQTGTLYAYTKNLGIYKCPSFAKIVANINGLGRFNGGLVWSTYTYNNSFTPSVNGVRIPISGAKITYSANTFVLYDEGPEFLNDADYLAWGADYPGGQHNDGSAVLCADGHAQRYRFEEISHGTGSPIDPRWIPAGKAAGTVGSKWCFYKPDRNSLDDGYTANNSCP
jgi:hypothetical protein